MDSFHTCKDIFCIKFLDFSKEIILTRDVSDVSFGAVLSPEPMGHDKPVDYAKQTLSGSEQKFSVIERELLSVVWSC